MSHRQSFFCLLCSYAEGKCHGLYPAARPMVNTQPRGRTAEDQSCCEKGQTFHTVIPVLLACLLLSLFSQFVFVLTTRNVNCASGQASLGCGIPSSPKSTHHFTRMSLILTSRETRRHAPLSKPSNTLLSETSSTCEYTGWY